MNREIIAILRGVAPDEVEAIGGVLVAAGVTRIEVPLNSPEPIESVRRLAAAYGDQAEIGAGTVLSAADVDAVAAVGGRMIVAPNVDLEVGAAALARGLAWYPGVFTATECFSALKAGASGLKIFPAFQMGSAGLRALRDVLPGDAKVYAVGGVGGADFAEWRRAGADGFGIGGALYRPGATPSDVAAAADTLVAAWDVSEP